MRILGTTIKASTIWALSFFAIAAYHFLSALLFLRAAIPTVAIVEGHRDESVTVRAESRYGGGQDTYNFVHPVIKFHTSNGNEYELSKPTPFGSYEEGQRVEILYDPRNPINSRQKSIGAIWGTSILFITLSSMILLCRLSIVVKKNIVTNNSVERVDKRRTPNCGVLHVSTENY